MECTIIQPLGERTGSLGGCVAAEPWGTVKAAPGATQQATDPPCQDTGPEKSAVSPGVGPEAWGGELRWGLRTEVALK